MSWLFFPAPPAQDGDAWSYGLEYILDGQPLVILSKDGVVTNAVESNRVLDGQPLIIVRKT